MIKEPHITLNMNGRSLSWFREKGYIVKQNSTIEVKPFDLPRTSKTKVTTICEECGVERVVTFADYSPICRKCSAPKNSKGLEYKGVNNPNYNHNMSEEERAEYKEREVELGRIKIGHLRLKKNIALLAIFVEIIKVET